MLRFAGAPVLPHIHPSHEHELAPWFLPCLVRSRVRTLVCGGVKRWRGAPEVSSRHHNIVRRWQPRLDLSDAVGRGMSSELRQEDGFRYLLCSAGTSQGVQPEDLLMEISICHPVCVVPVLHRPGSCFQIVLAHDGLKVHLPPHTTKSSHGFGLQYLRKHFRGVEATWRRVVLCSFTSFHPTFFEDNLHGVVHVRFSEEGCPQGAFAFPSLTGSGCDQGLCKCSQGALHSLPDWVGCDQGLRERSQGALASLIG